ncbi:hypothetical protein ACIBQ6_25325 [Nonomuraea sp. NPDC049655]|uniref:hypothetical protein n=1 Tax=Nonomuraea sp. NPDC049655 TaxID=3364355 RepID=UPI003792BB15
MYELELVDMVDESFSRCQVMTWTDGETYELRLDRAGVSPIRVLSSVDFEDGLRQLRTELERRNLLLLCNRYRRDAFVSSMSRQMSEGLSCYLVVAGEPVSPELLVDSLGPAFRGDVVSAEEASKFIGEWIAGFDD